MHRWFAVLALVALGAAGAACGEQGTSGAGAAEHTFTLQVKPHMVQLEVGGTAQLAATAVLDGAPNQDVTGKVTWSSQDPSVASVSLDGLIAAVAAGNTDVVVSYSGATVYVSVDVRPPAPVVGAINATFIQPVTTYTVPASGSGLHFRWSNTNPCGSFTAGDAPTASWSHPDGTTPGSCPNEAVHPGAITVIVTDAFYTCTAVYLNGSAQGTSPTSGSCVRRSR